MKALPWLVASLCLTSNRAFDVLQFETGGPAPKPSSGRRTGVAAARRAAKKRRRSR
jgi:hypothetical protein